MTIFHEWPYIIKPTMYFAKYIYHISLYSIGLLHENWGILSLVVYMLVLQALTIFDTTLVYSEQYSCTNNFIFSKAETSV